MEGHELVSHEKRENGDWVTTCSCGAKWSQPASRTQEYLNSLHETHVAYAKRQATRVD